MGALLVELRPVGVKYRLGLEDFQFSPSAAVGLFKSAISTVLIILSYKLADITTGYRII